MLIWRKAGAVVLASSVFAGLGWGSLSVGQEMIEQSESLVRVAVLLPERRETARQLGLYPARPNAAALTPVADEQNAAVLYEVLDAQIRAENDGDLPPAGELVAFLNFNRRTDKNRAAVRKLLERSEDLLRGVREAASRPRCRFTLPADAEASADDNLVWTQGYLVRLVLADAVCAVEDGRVEPALRSLDVALRIGRHAAERGDYDGLSCRAAAQGGAFAALAELTRTAGDRLPGLRPWIEGLLSDTPIGPDALRAAVSPTVRDTLDGLEQWRDKPFDILEGEFLLDYDPAWRALYELDRRLTRREWTDGMESLALDYFCAAYTVLETSPPSSVRDAWTALRDMDRAFREDHRDIPRRALPLRYASLPQAVLFAETRRAVARATLRLYDASESDATTDASVIPGEPIPDPFSPSGDALQLVVTPRGRRLLYSVGTNGTDEGGSLRRMNGTRGPTEDLVFRLDAP